MFVLDYIVPTGVTLSFFILAVIPLTRWFEKLNDFQETVTIEELIEDERKTV